LQPSGHHNGKPYGPHGLPPVPAKGRHFCLSEQAHKVKVKGGKISEIVVSDHESAWDVADTSSTTRCQLQASTTGCLLASCSLPRCCIA
jgi:hypothetical protein